MREEVGALRAALAGGADRVNAGVASGLPSATAAAIAQAPGSLMREPSPIHTVV